MKILITESQLKLLILSEGNQKIKVTDHCGVTKEYDYQTWYYDITEYNPQGSNWDGVKSNPRKDLYTYVVDGTKLPYTAKFTGDWSYLIPKMASKTPEQIKSLKYNICNPNKMYGGDYRKQPNLITLAVKDIQSFASWFPQTIQEWVDWITWFLESFGGPQGKAIATMAEAIQGVGYIIFAGTQKTLIDYVKMYIEGVSKLFSVLDIKIKIPGLSDWLDRIVKYVEGTGFSSILSRLTSIGAKINTKFDSQPKWLQAVITLLVQVAGKYVSQGINWVINNMLTPLYNLIKQYNPALADYIKGFIDYMSIFLSLVDTASLIVTDLNEKGILTKVTKS